MSETTKDGEIREITEIPKATESQIVLGFNGDDISFDGNMVSISFMEHAKQTLEKGACKRFGMGSMEEIIMIAVHEKALFQDDEVKKILGYASFTFETLNDDQTEVKVNVNLVNMTGPRLIIAYMNLDNTITEQTKKAQASE